MVEQPPPELDALELAVVVALALAPVLEAAVELVVVDAVAPTPLPDATATLVAELCFAPPAPDAPPLPFTRNCP